MQFFELIITPRMSLLSVNHILHLLHRTIYLKLLKTQLVLIKLVLTVCDYGFLVSSRFNSLKPHVNFKLKQWSMASPINPKPRSNHVN